MPRDAKSPEENADAIARSQMNGGQRYGSAKNMFRLGVEKGERRVQPNTQLFVARLEELIDKYGFKDPIHVLLEIANNCTVDPLTGIPSPNEKASDPKARAMAAGELLSYAFPKRKSVDVTMEEGTQLVFQIVQDTDPLPTYDDVPTIEGEKVPDHNSNPKLLPSG